MTHTQESGAPSGGRHPGVFAQLWSLVVNGLSALGTGLICVLMVIICADIVARNVMGASLPLVSEAGAMLVVLIVALQLSASVGANRLARAEILSAHLEARHPRFGAALETLFCLAGAGIVGAIAWSSLRIFERDLSSHEFIGTPGIGTLPTWPFRALIMLGMAVAAVQFLVGAYRSARIAAGGAQSQ